jgi:hypothetical protein
MEYKEKYLKYKNKYLELKIKLNGGNLVTTPQEYKRVFEDKKTDVTIQNLVGRVLRGTKPEDFIDLSPDVNRKLILFMDSNGLQNILGKSLDEILDIIGYPCHQILKLFREGVKFKLLVATSGDQILNGTWDNLLKLVKSKYSSTRIPEYLERNLEELKKNSFKDGYENIMKLKDPSFIDKKMSADELNSREGKLWEVRLFLHHVFNLNELYSGNGYTYNEKGEKGLAEYFSINQPISNLENVVLIDLN